MKKILLINPKSGFAEFSFNEPLVLGVLAALTPDNYEVEFIDENFEPFTYTECDIVALTSSSSTINRAYGIAKEYTSNGIPAIIGGIHVSHLPDEAAHYVTSVVVGDAEGVWETILNDFENNALKKTYKNLDHSNRFIVAPDRSIFKKYPYGAASIETSRGCTGSCDYCSIHALYNHRRYKRPVDEIVRDFETIDKGVVFFTDDNFLGNFHDKDRIKSILKALSKFNKKWAAFCTIEIIKHPDLLKLFKETGCIILYIGIETDKIDTLTSIRKSVNKRVFDNYSLKDCLKIIHSYSITVMGFLIFGFDSDQSLDEMHYRLKRIHKSGIDWIVIFILTPIPGSPVFHQLKDENRIIMNNYPEDWEKYDFTRAVFKPKHFQPETLNKFFISTNRFYFNRRNTLHRFFRTLKETKSLQTTVYLYIWVINNWSNVKKYWFMRVFNVLVKIFMR
ncbi:MAG: B12-binding domain-containing radical SAM protein [Bacteroidota bacterium]